MPQESTLITLETADVHTAARRPARYLNVLLALMLLALHFAIAWGHDDWWQRGLMLSHLGLFLIWQPVWSGERQVPAALAVAMLGLGVIFAFSGSWWIIGTWMALLFGLIGGSVLGRASRRDRFVSILAAVYLIAMVLMWVVPQVFTHYQPMSGVTALVHYGLLVLPLLILVIPGGEHVRGEPVVVDLFYSVMLFLLVVALALGSFVIYELTRGAYLLGLAQTLMVIAAVLAALSWLWNPRAGFGGIGTLVSQYLLGLGLPFEQRMRRLAEMAHTESRPEQFLRNALIYLLELQWVTGFAWVTPLSAGEVGGTDVHIERMEAGVLKLMLYSPRPFSPAVLLHLKLLMQMVEHFYGTLLREQQRQQSAYTQAIYETGARLTHDIKNLLQSLRAICAAAEMRGAEDPTAFRSLVQRQLPQITQRLGATLEKLRSPEVVDSSEVDAAIWWQALQIRYAGRAVDFQGADIPGGTQLPADLFDSVADTLIENALYKATQTTALRIAVTLGAGPRLTVVDDGVALTPAMAGEIFRAPVTSDSGLGVGLLQAAKFAEQSGYRLDLRENRDGAVSFELAPVC